MKIPVHDSVHDMFLCLHIVCLNISIIRSSAPEKRNRNPIAGNNGGHVVRLLGGPQAN